MSHRLTFLRLLRSALNPATLVTAGAPWLIAVSEAFYVANKAGGYGGLIALQGVCALLEHRTQLYTLIVAYFFYLFIVVRVCLTSGKTGSGSWNYYRLEKHKYIVLILVPFIGLTIYMGWLVLGGRVMTQEILDIYGNLPSCQHGAVVGTELPPLASPLTWLRVIIGVLAAATVYLDRNQYDEG
ncbi:MAG TPA: hypothetical protein VJS64_16110 [Pyrinomonadaceae bacterium]|nr:hypothetical protein [Pyrinomonadaceae bacterium]